MRQARPPEAPCAPPSGSFQLGLAHVIPLGTVWLGGGTGALAVVNAQANGAIPTTSCSVGLSLATKGEGQRSIGKACIEA